MPQDKPMHITIDLNRLQDPSYMEVLTSMDGWAKLEEYFRDTAVVSLLDQVRDLAIPEDLRREMIRAFLQSLGEEDRARIESLLQISDLLDTIIDARSH